MHEQAGIVLTIGLALWVGIMMLSLARWLKVPPLLFYLLAGLCLGPMGLGWLHPSTLGAGLPILVEFGLAIMLFEGALNLPRSEPMPTSSRRLLGVGMPLTAVLAACTARCVAGFGWLPAIAFGALIVVTGPTTIGPLLRSLSIGRRLEKVFRHEAIWGDCLGILLASVVLPFWITSRPRSLIEVPILLVEKASLSVILGIVVGLVLGRWLLPLLARLGDPELPGLVALACAWMVFSGAHVISPGSGPIASAVAGFTLAFQKTPYVREIRAFKGQITYLFISLFFVLLAGLFDLQAIPADLGPLLLTALVLGLVVRPVSFYAAFYGTDLPLNERTYLAFIGPRGVIALATASYIVTQRPDDPSAVNVFALTFLVIFFSGAFATLAARPFARLVKVRVPEYRTGIVILGINDLSKALARQLSLRVPVKLVDSDPLKTAEAQIPGVETVLGSGLNDELYEEAAEEGFRRVLAMTPNDALNAMCLEHAEHIFGPNRVFQVRQKAGNELARRIPHFTRRLAFGKDFHAELLGVDPGGWSIRESETLEDGLWPIASLRRGGARLCRAGSTEAGPYLVLDLANSLSGDAV